MATFSYAIWLGTKFPVANTSNEYQERVFVNRTDKKIITAPVGILYSKIEWDKTHYYFKSNWWVEIRTTHKTYFKNKLLERWLKYLENKEKLEEE